MKTDRQHNYISGQAAVSPSYLEWLLLLQRQLSSALFLHLLHKDHQDTKSLDSFCFLTAPTPSRLPFLQTLIHLTLSQILQVPPNTFQRHIMVPKVCSSPCHIQYWIQLCVTASVWLIFGVFASTEILNVLALNHGLCQCWPSVNPYVWLPEELSPVYCPMYFHRLKICIYSRSLVFHIKPGSIFCLKWNTLNYFIILLWIKSPAGLPLQPAHHFCFYLYVL